MKEIRVIGMVIYTYAILEERLEELWNWLKRVEEWSGQPYAEFHFSSRAKQSLRVWKATERNRAKLYDRLHAEQPWFVLDFGWPRGALDNVLSKTKGLDVALRSRPQPSRGGESYRSPSYIWLGMHPEVLIQSSTGVSGLLELGVQAWEIIDGVYGFIDVETGIPLRDDILRNAIHLFDSTVPKEYEMEFLLWVHARSELDKRVWKAFWGNFLGAEHLRQLGGIEEMRRADPLYRRLPEYLEQAYQQGRARLRESSCYHEWRDLAHGGVLLTLSESPLDWFEKQVQERKACLQEVFGQVALGPWDYDRYNLTIFRKEQE